MVNKNIFPDFDVLRLFHHYRGVNAGSFTPTDGGAAKRGQEPKGEAMNDGPEKRTDGKVGVSFQAGLVRIARAGAPSTPRIFKGRQVRWYRPAGTWCRSIPSRIVMPRLKRTS